MPKPKSIPENKKYKILWDFQIQTDPLIQDKRSDLVMIFKKKGKKEKLLHSGVYHLSESQSENQQK